MEISLVCLSYHPLLLVALCSRQADFDGVTSELPRAERLKAPTQPLRTQQFGGMSYAWIRYVTPVHCSKKKPAYNVTPRFSASGGFIRLITGLGYKSPAAQKQSLEEPE